MAKKEFHTSGQLMEAIRALDYKAQYMVCEALYKISKEIDWSDRWMFQRFEESFTMIDAENLEAHFVELHWAMNDMDNFLYETGFDCNVVLSEDDYHHLYSDSYHWANVAQLWALTHTTCIFVGLSMTDPSLRRLLDIAYKQGSQDVEHYAFLIRTEFECHRENYEDEENKDMSYEYKRSAFIWKNK